MLPTCRKGATGRKKGKKKKGMRQRPPCQRSGELHFSAGIDAGRLLPMSTLPTPLARRRHLVTALPALATLLFLCGTALAADDPPGAARPAADGSPAPSHRVTLFNGRDM